MRRSIIAALVSLVLLVWPAQAQLFPGGAGSTPGPSAATSVESADIALSKDAGYWSSWTEAADLAQTQGGVKVQVIWTGVTEASKIPSAVKALSVTSPQAYIGIRLRIENGSTGPATLHDLDATSNIFAAKYTTLVTPAGEIKVRDFSNAQGREEIPPGTFRTYELVFQADQPAADIKAMTLNIPRLRGVRWVPIGDADYSLQIQMISL